MTILNRYLLRRNLFLLFALLFLGSGIYILSDLFQRIDVFIDAGFGIGSIALFFLIKLPLIISQILPAVFLLSLVVQLSLMNKHRESMALEAGGVSPLSMFKFVLVYGLCWSVLQFCFSQVLGVTGEHTASRIWQQDVKGRDTEGFSLEKLWFTSGNLVIYLGEAWPNQERAEQVNIYQLSADGLSIERNIKAEVAESSSDRWLLRNVSEMRPASFSYEKLDELWLEVGQTLEVFKTFEPKSKTSELGILVLSERISALEQAGTNVEIMRTDFHNRFAYSASLLVMGLLALAIVIRTDNIYLACVISFVSTFMYYAVSSFFVTAGERALLPPILAVWLPNLIFFALSGGYLLSRSLRKFKLNSWKN